MPSGFLDRPYAVPPPPRRRPNSAGTVGSGLALAPSSKDVEARLVNRLSALVPVRDSPTRTGTAKGSSLRLPLGVRPDIAQLEQCFKGQSMPSRPRKEPIKEANRRCTVCRSRPGLYHECPSCTARYCIDGCLQSWYEKDKHRRGTSQQAQIAKANPDAGRVTLWLPSPGVSWKEERVDVELSRCGHDCLLGRETTREKAGRRWSIAAVDGWQVGTAAPGTAWQPTPGVLLTLDELGRCHQCEKQLAIKEYVCNAAGDQRASQQQFHKAVLRPRFSVADAAVQVCLDAAVEAAADVVKVDVAVQAIGAVGDTGNAQEGRTFAVGDTRPIAHISPTNVEPADPALTAFVGASADVSSAIKLVPLDTPPLAAFPSDSACGSLATQMARQETPPFVTLANASADGSLVSNLAQEQIFDWKRLSVVQDADVVSSASASTGFGRSPNEAAIRAAAAAEAAAGAEAVAEAGGRKSLQNAMADLFKRRK